MNDLYMYVCSDETEDGSDKSSSYQYRIKLKFATKVFGSFKQSLIFDFGSKPLLFKVNKQRKLI